MCVEWIYIEDLFILSNANYDQAEQYGDGWIPISASCQMYLYVSIKLET